VTTIQRTRLFVLLVLLGHLGSLLLGVWVYAVEVGDLVRVGAGVWITLTFLGTLFLCSSDGAFLRLGRRGRSLWNGGSFFYLLLFYVGLWLIPGFWFVRSWKLFYMIQMLFLSGVFQAFLLWTGVRGSGPIPDDTEEEPQRNSIRTVRGILGFLILFGFGLRALDAHALVTGGPPVIGAITGLISGVLAGVLFLKTAALMALSVRLWKASRPRLCKGLLLLGSCLLLCFALPFLMAPVAVSQTKTQLEQAFGSDSNMKEAEKSGQMMSVPCSGVSFYYGLGPYPNCERKRHILYKETKDYKLHFDVFYPKKEAIGGHATILFIHGGGWHLGDTGMVWQKLAYLASRGYVVFDIQYRLMDPALVDVKRELGVSTRPRGPKGPAYLCGPYRIPDMVRDVGDLTHYLADPSHETFGADLSRAFVMGQSAGGHLAGVVGFGYDHPYFDGVFSEALKLQGIILYYPPDDMARMVYYDHPMFATFGLIEGSPESNPEEYLHYTPSHLIQSGEPPTLIFQGTVDHMVPLYNARKIEAKLREVETPTVWMNGYFGGHAHDMTPSHGTPGLYILERFLYLVLQRDSGFEGRGT